MSPRLSPCPPSPAARVASGFTLLEVLVALVVVGVALFACLSRVGNLAQNNASLRATILANWAAENRMVQIRLAHEFPPIGKRSFDCPQAELHLVCDEEVQPTPNPNFRRIDISVHDSANPERRITKLIQVASNG
jgi:general secretion pathway protein I